MSLYVCQRGVVGKEFECLVQKRKWDREGHSLRLVYILSPKDVWTKYQQTPSCESRLSQYDSDTILK